MIKANTCIFLCSICLNMRKCLLDRPDERMWIMKMGLCVYTYQYWKDISLPCIIHFKLKLHGYKSMTNSLFQFSSLGQFCSLYTSTSYLTSKPTCESIHILHYIGDLIFYSIFNSTWYGSHSVNICRVDIDKLKVQFRLKFTGLDIQSSSD